MTLKRNSVSLESRGCKKKRKSREHESKLGTAGTSISIPVRRHAVRHHLPWFVVPDTECWTCKRQYGSSSQLKKNVDEERIKSELDPQVNQEPHQMVGQEHMVRTRIWIRPTGSQTDGERESGAPVGLGQCMCYQ